MQPSQHMSFAVPRLCCGGAVLAVLSLGGCAEPELEQPELRPSGPPDVLNVVIARGWSPSALMLEESTYCRPGDTQRPARVALPDLSVAQVCPDDVSQPVEEFRRAYPASWYARIVFDELLDLTPSELEEPGRPVLYRRLAAESQDRPVRMQCNGVEVPYVHGYLDKGNRATWPMAPSIKVSPVSPAMVPAGAHCEIVIEREIVRDKSGVPPADVGPFAFQIAPIEIVVPDGAARAPYGTTGPVPTLAAGNPPFRIDFNHFLDPSSLVASSVRVFRGADGEDPQTPERDCLGGSQVAAGLTLVSSERPGQPSSVEIFDATLAAGSWMSNRHYRVELGGVVVRDLAGGQNELAPIRLCFRARP